MDTSDENIAQLELPEKVKAERRGRRKKKLTVEATVELTGAEKLARGQKLTNERKADLIKFIRNGLIGGLHPSMLRQAAMTQFKLGRFTVDKYIAFVRSEQLKEVGYYREQIQEICQKALVTIVQNGQKGQAKPEAVVKAVVVLHNIFDIKVTPEDTSQQKKMFAEEAMAKMDSMSIQELQEFSNQLRNGGEKLTPEMLLMSPADHDKDPAKHKKRRGK